MKKKLIHFIFDLGRGGAETMMVRVIKELPEYEHVVVTLFPKNRFGKELACDRLICLNLKSLHSLPVAVLRFRRVLNIEKPDLVHTHLFWPTVIARMSVPKRIPLVTTIHAFIASSLEYKHFHIRLLDRLTYCLRKNIIIVVAKGALKEYFSFLKLEPYKSYNLYTFVDVNRFDARQIEEKKKELVFRIVSTGALREQKNYSFLIDQFSHLKDLNIELHIYGSGSLRKILQQQIDETGAKVILKGEVNNLEKVLPGYDLYVASSSFEGFSLSVLEAMAMKLPMLLSDIESFREQCESTAVYFDLKGKNDFIQRLNELIADEPKRKELSEMGYERVTQNFTLTNHVSQLKNIYSETLSYEIKDDFQMEKNLTYIFNE